MRHWQRAQFPQPAIFELLWRAWKRTGQPAFPRGGRGTLEQMARAESTIHLGAVLRAIPSMRAGCAAFEKMLYDNAELI